MPPETWGPPIWTLFHTLAEKVKEDHFNKIGMELFMKIKQICQYLPCPDCSNHANQFLAKVKPETISNKYDFKSMLFFFHNLVNKRKNKKLYNFDNIEVYKDKNIIQCFNNFINAYTVKGNMKLLADTMQRQHIMNGLKKWLQENIDCFEM